MRDKFRILLGIETKETLIVSMLLTQSVFLGIFIGAYDISAYSLLLSTFDEKMMAFGYVISGLSGILLTSFFFKFRKKNQLSKIAFTNLVIVTIATLLLWSGLKFFHEKWTVVVVFIMAGPLNILTLFGFWALPDKYFGTNKKLSGMADSGFLTGIALISFIIPLLLTFKFKAHSILLLAGLSVLIAAFLQKVLSVHLKSDKTKIAGKSEKPVSKSFLSLIRKNKLYRILSLYATLSVLVAFVILYSFITITHKQYPVAEDMAGFLGLFIGSMMLFTEFVKRIIYPPLIRFLGIRGCLIISPVIIVMITFLSIVIGLAMGYTGPASGYIVFFIILACNRFISKSVKDSIEVPSFRVIYQSIQGNVKTEIQNGISYSVNEVGMLLSGTILSLFGLLSFIKLIHFSLLLLILLAVWMYLAFRLYKEYRNSITKTIERADEPITHYENPALDNDFKNRFTGQLFFRTNYFNLLIGDYDVLNNIRNEWYHKELIDFSLSKNDLNLVRVLKTVSINGDLN